MSNSRFGFRTRAGNIRSIIESAGVFFLLDTAPGAAAAYSLRKLRNSYTGDAIRVRRSSDNAEQNIGFSGDGLDIAALTTFCTGTNGFVTTWYDQSGNTENLTQTSSVAQPKIYDSASGVVTLFGRPSILFDGSNDYMYRDIVISKPQPIYVEIVSSYPNTSRFIFDASEPNRIAFLTWNSAKDGYSFAGTDLITTTGTFSAGSRYLISLLFNGASSTIYQNTVLRKTGNSGANGVSDLFLGARFSLSNFADMLIQEIILWPSDLTSIRLNIANNINTYYSIY